jgi:hypothetical protein
MHIMQLEQPFLLTPRQKLNQFLGCILSARICKFINMQMAVQLRVWLGDR